MNDYWNDPAEEPEPPSCPCPGDALCAGFGEYQRTDETGMVFKCDTCGAEFGVKIHDPAPEPEPAEPITWDDRMTNFGPKCPHGNEWFDCDACAQASDLAYDASREKRH